MLFMYTFFVVSFEGFTYYMIRNENENVAKYNNRNQMYGKKATTTKAHKRKYM